MPRKRKITPPCTSTPYAIGRRPRTTSTTSSSQATSTSAAATTTTANTNINSSKLPSTTTTTTRSLRPSTPTTTITTKPLRRTCTKPPTSSNPITRSLRLPSTTKRSRPSSPHLNISALLKKSKQNNGLSHSRRIDNDDGECESNEDGSVDEDKYNEDRPSGVGDHDASNGDDESVEDEGNEDCSNDEGDKDESDDGESVEGSSDEGDEDEDNRIKGHLGAPVQQPDGLTIELEDMEPVPKFHCVRCNTSYRSRKQLVNHCQHRSVCASIASMLGSERRKINIAAGAGEEVDDAEEDGGMEMDRDVERGGDEEMVGEDVLLIDSKPRKTSTRRNSWQRGVVRKRIRRSAADSNFAYLTASTSTTASSGDGSKRRSRQPRLQSPVPSTSGTLQNALASLSTVRKRMCGPPKQQNLVASTLTSGTFERLYTTTTTTTNSLKRKGRLPKVQSPAPSTSGSELLKLNRKSIGSNAQACLSFAENEPLATSKATVESPLQQHTNTSQESNDQQSIRKKLTRRPKQFGRRRRRRKNLNVSSDTCAFDDNPQQPSKIVKLIRESSSEPSAADDDDDGALTAQQQPAPATSSPQPEVDPILEGEIQKTLEIATDSEPATSSRRSSQNSNATEHNEPSTSCSSNREDVYLCPECQKCYDTRDQIQVHLIEQHELHLCMECDGIELRTFTNKWNMIRHVRSLHQQLGRVVCSLCKLLFSTKLAMLNHVQRVHSISGDRGDDRREEEMKEEVEDGQQVVVLPSEVQLLYSSQQDASVEIANEAESVTNSDETQNVANPLGVVEDALQNVSEQIPSHDVANQSEVVEDATPNVSNPIRIQNGVVEGESRGVANPTGVDQHGAQNVANQDVFENAAIPAEVEAPNVSNLILIQTGVVEGVPNGIDKNVANPNEEAVSQNVANENGPENVSNKNGVEASVAVVEVEPEAHQAIEVNSSESASPLSGSSPPIYQDLLSEEEDFEDEVKSKVESGGSRASIPSTTNNTASTSTTTNTSTITTRITATKTNGDATLASSS